ncbi:LCP family protein [Phaeacidiphilus oryzae]|uniref:LCP family protein n=1 Tax=Phaeacidiphilus oryzae TaxID=348818 RepID=UPI000560B3B8|nr:LCP family protein [Phaeacidiphilus oryzae]
MVAICLVSGWLYVKHLDGNIQHGALSAGDMPSSSSDGALNILLIGSDSRNTAEDLKLGGAKSSVGGPLHADVEMLLHVSADHSNASLLSIPRDTMVDIPQCKDPKTGKVYPATPHQQITTSLSRGGPSCTVYTWYKLTGIPINHYMMVDFSGVVSMADAVGGVPVCVDNNVYDPDSHLRLTKGDHVIKGVQALEWLRTRHGFGDGSDLYRTQVQHMYLTSMMRRLKSGGTLGDPSKVLDLADAATKALSVDDGLDSVTKLAGLGTELKGLQLDRLTTLTMPYAADPQNPTAWVIPKPGDADQIFAMIRNDVSLDSHGKPAKATSSASSGPASGGASVAAYAVNVEVENGGTVTGRADQITTALKADGFRLATTAGNAPQQQATSTVNYPPGDEDKAKAVAAALKLPASAVKSDPTATMTTVVVGGDWPSGDTYGSKPSAGAVPTSAPKQSGNQTMCAHVNPAFAF